MRKAEAIEDAGDSLTLCEVLDSATRGVRSEIGARVWPTWTKERRSAEISRVFSLDRSPTFHFFEVALEHAAEEVIHHIAERKGWRVAIERDGEVQRDPWLAAALRRVKGEIELVERRLAVQRDHGRPIRKE